MHVIYFEYHLYFVAFICTGIAGALNLFNLTDFKFRDWLIRDDPIIMDLDRWDSLMELVEEETGIGGSDSSDEETEEIFDL